MLRALLEFPDWASTVTVWLLHVAAVGQVIFLTMWMTLPWWKAWVGRALMVKSLALAAFLVVAVIHEHVSPYGLQPAVVALLFAAVTAGIWSQVVAIGLEIREAREDDRRVTGTDDLKKRPTPTPKG